jgi:hypothetical protein
MIDIQYLKEKLEPRGFVLETAGEMPMFFKRLTHKNGSSLYAFTLIMVSLDKYTVTVEGFNEILINRAVKANAISIDTYEELDALREIVYDDTLDDMKRFETLFTFLSAQLDVVVSEPVQSDEHQKALENISLMVDAAKATY